MPSDSKYTQGKFRPRNPKKYLGNPNNIIYRSSWELEFLRWCDRNISVLEYASEEFSIPYVSPIDNKVHRYYPDFLMKIKESDGKIKKYVIEVKPKKQTGQPKKRKRITKSYIYECQTYAKNQAKWEAAKEFCKDNSLEFKIITEDQLYGKKLPRKSNK